MRAEAITEADDGWTGEGDGSLRRLLSSARTQFAAASRKVGQKPTQRLRWLIDAVQRPRDEMIEELRLSSSNLAFELCVFAGIADPREYRSRFVELVQAIETVDRSARRLAQEGRWLLEFPGDVSGLVIERSFRQVGVRRRAHKPPRGEAFFDARDPVVKVLFRIDELIASDGARVCECLSATCRLLFVKVRRADFCSERCALRERKRRYRSRLKERERVNHQNSEEK